MVDGSCLEVSDDAAIVLALRTRLDLLGTAAGATTLPNGLDVTWSVNGNAAPFTTGVTNQCNPAPGGTEDDT